MSFKHTILSVWSTKSCDHSFSLCVSCCHENSLTLWTVSRKTGCCWQPKIYTIYKKDYPTILGLNVYLNCIRIMYWCKSKPRWTPTHFWYSIKTKEILGYHLKDLCSFSQGDFVNWYSNYLRLKSPQAGGRDFKKLCEYLGL